MEHYNDKTKEELLLIVEKLEKKVKRLSSELSSSKKERFRDKYNTRILDALPDMLTVFDHDANIVELVSSSSTNHVEGTTADSIINSNVKDIIPEDAYESVYHNMEKVIRTGKSSIAQHSLEINGVLHHYENRIFPLDDEYLLCMCRDISQQIEMEKINSVQRNEITRLNSLMNAILNNVPVYLFVKDTGNDFRYLYWNKAFAEHSGIPVEKVIGRTDHEVFSNEADMEKFHKDDLKVLKEGMLDVFEEYTDAHGKVRIVKTIKRIVPSGNDSPYIIGISWDVTDIKNTEKELIAARIKAEESDRLKSAFLANMSHEIRTPLNAIVGFSKIITEAKSEEEKGDYAEIIELNSTILLNLFNDILDLSALEAGSLEFSMEKIKIHDACLQAHQLHCNAVQKGVKLILDKVDPEVYAWGDWNRTIQILNNLISNAIKFTATGEIHFGFQKKENYTLLYVEDTGIGIPAKKAATIFRRFGKVNNFIQGTGLGLTICRMLVEKMGGRIWLRSKTGEGTIFYFTLPCSK